jgi:hypothetical protein
LLGNEPVAYKCAILSKSVEDNNDLELKRFTFKILRSTGDWIGLGVCHKKIVQANNYTLDFDHIGHGGYMISSNGGSWSNHDIDNNNVVKVFIHLI